MGRASIYHRVTPAEFDDAPSPDRRHGPASDGMAIEGEAHRDGSLDRHGASLISMTSNESQ